MMARLSSWAWLRSRLSSVNCSGLCCKDVHYAQKWIWLSITKESFNGYGRRYNHVWEYDTECYTNEHLFRCFSLNKIGRTTHLPNIFEPTEFGEQKPVKWCTNRQQGSIVKWRERAAFQLLMSPAITLKKSLRVQAQSSSVIGWAPVIHILAIVVIKRNVAAFIFEHATRTLQKQRVRRVKTAN